MNKRRAGFTTLELIVVVLIAGILTIFFFLQAQNMAAIKRDDYAKTAINAMYYSLEEINYPRDGYYPEELNEETLRGFDPQFFTDPFGVNVGTEGSKFRYEPSGCEAGKCQEYTLRAELEKEAEYVKRSRN